MSNESRIDKIQQAAEALHARLTKFNTCHSRADGQFCSTGGGGGMAPATRTSALDAMKREKSFKPHDMPDGSIEFRSKYGGGNKIVVKPDGSWTHFSDYVPGGVRESGKSVADLATYQRGSRK